MNDAQLAFYSVVKFVQSHGSIKWMILYVVFVALVLGMIGVGAGPSDRDD